MLYEIKKVVDLYTIKTRGEYMITLPIWLFILCIIIGFPLVIIILTFLSYTVYLGFLITINILKSLWFFKGEKNETSK
jgi:hypothetical protein